MLPAKITAPTEVGRYIFALSYRPKHHNISEHYNYNRYLDGMEVPYAQHLYLVSDREIKTGDYYCYKNSIPVKRLEKETVPITKDYKKVEASTDPSLGLPLIPKSFIEEYVEKQGKIENVYIALREKDVKTLSHNAKEIVIPSTKDSWKREEVREIARKAFQQGVKHGCDIYADNNDDEICCEWFDKNY